MKTIEAPKGKFKTQFGVLFNYEARGDSFRVTLPEGGVISIKGKQFIKVELELLPFPFSGWQSGLQSPGCIRRDKPCHDVTPSQRAEIIRIVVDSFNDFWSSDLFVADRFRRYSRFRTLTALITERDAARNVIEGSLIRIKELTDKIESYL